MLGWLFVNWQSILIGSILLLGVVLIIRKLIRDKKRGKGCGCGCGCEGCALSSQCHGKNQENK